MTELHYYKFRFTPSPTLDENLCQNVGRSFFREFLKIEELEFATFGFETKDKLGEDTDPHFHCHFASSNFKIGAVRKAIQRSKYALDAKAENRAKGYYSLTEETDVQSEERFFRYPFKQQGRCFQNWERLPDGFEIEKQVALACDEWERDIEFNQKVKERRERPTGKDVLFSHMDVLHQNTPFTNVEDILVAILDFYNTEEKSSNESTIRGYVNTAILRYGLMTSRDMAKKWLNNWNI